METMTTCNVLIWEQNHITQTIDKNMFGLGDCTNMSGSSIYIISGYLDIWSFEALHKKFNRNAAACNQQLLTKRDIVTSEKYLLVLF